MQSLDLDATTRSIAKQRSIANDLRQFRSMKAMCNGESFIDALVFSNEHEDCSRRPVDHHVLMATASRIEFR
jgi:hypothetical protein